MIKIDNDRRIYDLYIPISVTREEREKEGLPSSKRGELIKWRWCPLTASSHLFYPSLSPTSLPLPLSPLKLVTLKNTKKYDPYIYEIVYTLVIKN
jgi:hypothetical protein